MGSRNYQHPLRTLADFGPHLDNFSAWVVYLSLLALIAEPQLWQHFAAGDECLLLRRKDFEDPESSPVLRAIEALPDEHARTVAQLFKPLPYLALEQIPPLGYPITFAPTTQRAPTSWLEDHLPHRRTDSIQTPTSAPTADGDAAPVDVSWIIDGATPPARAESFEGSPTPERVVFGIFVLGAAALVLAMHAGSRSVSPSKPSAIATNGFSETNKKLFVHATAPSSTTSTEQRARRRRPPPKKSRRFRHATPRSTLP